MKIKKFFIEIKHYFINCIRKYIIKNEIQYQTKRVIYDEYTGIKLVKYNPNYNIFNPVDTVNLILKQHFNKYDGQYYALGIFGIIVDTQQEQINITIKLRHPHLLIGKHGQDFDELEYKLSKIFNVHAKIYIDEITKDINEPFIY